MESVNFTLTKRQIALAQAEVIEDHDTNEVENNLLERSLEPNTTPTEPSSMYRKKREKLADHEELADFTLVQKPERSSLKNVHQGLSEQPRRKDQSISKGLMTVRLPTLAPKLAPRKCHEPEVSSSADECAPRKVKRTYRRGPRNFWTDQETNDLKAGVALCGVGRWKDILEHPHFRFAEGRTHVDLKDKFRTLFPPGQPERWAYSTKENVDTTLLTVHKATRQRPPRKTWTEEEDAQLELGFEMYGFQWHLMVQDESLQLDHRRPGQLRDRFRRSHPEKYEEPAGASKLLMPKKRQGRPRIEQTKRKRCSTTASNSSLTELQSTQSANNEPNALLTLENGSPGLAEPDLPQLQWDDMAVQPMFDF